MSARHAISDAIRKGVPMWNKGDFRGCTKVYRDVAIRFAQVEPMLGKALKDIVGKPVDSSRNSQGMHLRHVFNEIRIKYDPVLQVYTAVKPSERDSIQSSNRSSFCSIMSLDSIDMSAAVMENKLIATQKSERLEFPTASVPETQPSLGFSGNVSTHQWLLNSNKQLTAEVLELKARIDRMDTKLDLILKLVQNQTLSVAIPQKASSTANV